jgi:hypothetical protein
MVGTIPSATGHELLVPRLSGLESYGAWNKNQDAPRGLGALTARELSSLTVNNS